MPRDPRPFITVHDGMPEHPKIEALSDTAFRLLVTTWCWCNRMRTDGKVKHASWVKRGTPKARTELINAGLAEVIDDGVQMHDYLQHQRSAAEIDELSKKRSEAGRKGGKAKASGLASAKQMPEQMAGKSVAEEEVEEEELEKNSSSSKARKRATRIPDDWKPTESDVAWQREQHINDLLARREYPKFLDYWRAKSGQAATKLDWSATWRNWLRTAVERQPKQAVGASKPPGWEFGMGR